jgi:hypothetical protein
MVHWWVPALFFPGELIDFGDLQLPKVREKVFESPDFYI